MAAPKVDVYLSSEAREAAELPLLASVVCVIAPSRRALIQIEAEPRPLIPQRALQPGEQYRFHFDMSKCIGCKCCVVACNEQNGNPAPINWRRVGELEGGHYPNVQRYHLSMGCNHCLEPSCLIGCPVEAYHKDAKTGVVIHDPEVCIGCQYCTWNCSYGVPRYNPERGVVGKCDLCHNRLADGMAPACASACPEGAIQVEIVDIEQWRRDYVSANAPGLPVADDSISTTRITLPENLSPDMGRVDTQRIVPEEPHWPLVFMLVLTQLSVGAFAALCAFSPARQGGVGLQWEKLQLVLPKLAAFALAGAGLAMASLHLGRPIYAWRALKGLRRSWLSREVLSLSIFAGAAGLYVAGLPLALLTVIAGFAGVLCSARIYMVAARPAWNSRYTLLDFFSTALMLGPMLVLSLEGHGLDPSVRIWLTRAAAAGAACQLLTQALRFLWLARSEQFELRASALLLSGRLRRAFLIRLALLIAVGTSLSLSYPAAFGLALVGEWMGRWLFFVSVVPKNIAAAFTRSGRAA